MSPPPGIVARAPVRICDVGGWTDTWFGAPGRVVNLAAGPGVEVTVRPSEGPAPVILAVGNIEERYALEPRERRVTRHPLVEAALDAHPPPPDSPVEITVTAAVPAGSGTGSSAALGVALLGALLFVRGEGVAPRRVAEAAHRLEVELLGEESGVQDQLAAALGGANYLEVEPYPVATVHPLPVPNHLGSHLTTIFLGQPHHSTSLHRRVIRSLKGRSTDVFEPFRTAAAAARRALELGDLSALGRAMTANTEAQAQLHPDLVGMAARRVIDAASSCGAAGWKVNGAGGAGGSVTVLSSDRRARRDLEERLLTLSPTFRVLELEPALRGLEIRAEEVRGEDGEPGPQSMRRSAIASDRAGRENGPRGHRGGG